MMVLKRQHLTAAQSKPTGTSFMPKAVRETRIRDQDQYLPVRVIPGTDSWDIGTLVVGLLFDTDCRTKDVAVR